MEDESYMVVIEGGSPWGFGIQGGLDFRSPLRVKMVSPGGRASKSGLIAGDYIIAINGELTKPLKHMEAQQLIKKSKQRVELTCVKLRPGLISPALGKSSFSFSSQTQNGGTSPKPTAARSPVITSKPIARPAPPPVVVNGHPRRSSVGTPSDSTTSSSPHSCIGETYEAKYMGMDSYCIDKSHPMADEEVQECVDVAQVEAEAPVMYNLGEGETPQEVIQEVADVVEVKDEVHASYNLVSMEEPTEADQHQNLPPEPEQVEEVVDNNDREAISEPVEAVTITPKDVDITCDLQGEKSPVTETTEAVMMHATPVEIQCGTTTEESEVKKSPPQRKASPSVNKMDLVNIITHAAERKRRESRGSSTDSEDPTRVPSSPAQVTKAHSPKITPKQQSPPKTTPSGKSVMSASKPPKPVRAVSIEAKEEVLPVAMQPLKKTENTVANGNKDPGWYKQMFQDFQNTVEETFPGSSSKTESEYVFDERGLKVRRDSLPRDTEPQTPPRDTAPSPEDPVYVIDDRGLRVRAGSLSKVQRSTSPQMEKIKSEQRPKSANTPKLSVDSGMSTNDVLSASKKQTSYKASLYSTEGSKDYWQQKDQDQKDFDEIRRKNSEERHVRQSSNSSDYANKMSSMHPLLQAGAQDSKEKQEPTQEPESEKVFERIDASKLQGALENASMLNKLEQEGVATDLLPGVAKGIQEEKNKPKEKQLKPPPGRKGRALFSFDGHSAKELSFKKGDIVDLLHTVDANWLQGSFGGAKGIFPSTYIKVLSLDEYRDLISPEPKPRVETGRAKALYDFQGQSAKELSFSKDDELIIKKKIDDNWYEGYHGDKEGIFPVVYVTEL